MVQVLEGGSLFFCLVSLISVLISDIPISCTFVPCQSISMPYVLLHCL